MNWAIGVLASALSFGASMGVALLFSTWSPITPQEFSELSAVSNSSSDSSYGNLSVKNRDKRRNDSDLKKIVSNIDVDFSSLGSTIRESLKNSYKAILKWSKDNGGCNIILEKDRSILEIKEKAIISGDSNVFFKTPLLWGGGSGLELLYENLVDNEFGRNPYLPRYHSLLSDACKKAGFNKNLDLKVFKTYKKQPGYIKDTLIYLGQTIELSRNPYAFDVV